MIVFRKEIFKVFFKGRNFILGTLLTILLTTLLYGFMPIGYLAYGVFNFIQTVLLLLVLLINVEDLNYFQKYKKDFFYTNLFISMILFLIPMGFFIIALLSIYQIFFESAQFVSNIFSNMPTFINWGVVNWYVLAYVFFINIAVIFILFILLKGFRKRTLTFLLLFFVILILFTGGFFVGFAIDKNILSSFGTKIINFKEKALIIRLFSWLNPFYWINLMSSTIFITSGIFENYNEFTFSIEDLISFFSIFAPIMFISATILIISIKRVFFKRNE